MLRLYGRRRKWKGGCQLDPALCPGDCALKHNHSLLWALFPDTGYDIAYYNQALS
jgi:hypothetical protein